MKNILSVLFLLFLCHFGASAQCNYDLLIKEGRGLFEKEQYRAALKKFNAARTCDPTKSGEVDKEVDRVFNAIEAQRDEAQRERRNTQNALDEKERAEAATMLASQLAEKERQKMEIEKNKAERALKLADTMRDSARMAQNSEKRLLSFQESNELMRLGEAKFYEKDYERAVYLYEKANGLLKNLDQRDSIVAAKVAVATEKMDQANRIWSKSKLHKGLIAKGDSLVTAGWEYYVKAYRVFQEAKTVGFDSIQCAERLNNLEKLIDGTSFSKKDKKSAGFQKLMIASANEYRQIGLNRISDRRLKTALKYGFEDIGDIQDARQRLIAIRHIRQTNFRRRMEIQIGSKVYYPYLNDLSEMIYKYNLPYIYSETFHPEDTSWVDKGLKILQIGLDLHITQKLGVGISYGYKSGHFAKYNDNLGRIKQSEFSFYAFYDLLNKKNPQRKQPVIQIQPKIGFSFGKSLHFDFVSNYFYTGYTAYPGSPLYERTKNLYNSGYSSVGNYQKGKNAFDFYIYKYTYNQDTAYALTVDLLRSDQSLKKYENIFLSTKIQIFPSSKSGFSFFIEPSLNLQIAPLRKTEVINSAEIIRGIYESRGTDLNLDEQQGILNQMYEVELLNWNKSFNSGFSLQFGLSYRF